MDDITVFKELRKRLGWDIDAESVVMTSESTVDPRIMNVTINFKVIKHEP